MRVVRKLQVFNEHSYREYKSRSYTNGKVSDGICCVKNLPRVRTLGNKNLILFHCPLDEGRFRLLGWTFSTGCGERKPRYGLNSPLYVWLILGIDRKSQGDSRYS